MVHQILQPSDADPASPGPAGWGPVPTLGGDVTTSIPDPVTGTSATSTQQSATAATQSVSQTVFLPPAPTWSALLDPNGNMTAAWITWFQVLNRKLGGYTSTPTDDAEILAYEPESVDQSARAAMAILDAYSGGDVRVVAAPTTDSLWDDSSIGWVKGQKYLAGITASAPLSGLGTVTSPLTLPGVLAGTISVVAGATLTAGQWVNVYNNAGTANVRPADSTDATKPVHGFVLAGVASTATSTVYLGGPNTVIPVGSFVAADLGKPVFLSTSGATTLTAPSTTGNLLQQVGWVDAVGTTVIVNLINSPGIVRA